MATNRKSEYSKTHSNRASFFDRWLQDADYLAGPVMSLLNSTLEDTIRARGCSEDRIGEFVAHHSLRWQAPDRFLRMVDTFVADFCEAVDHQDKETEEFIQRLRPLVRPSICYTVFHHGEEHFYANELPKEVLNLRRSILFWIYRAKKEFLSCGQKRKALRPLTERVLRFICSKRNAGNIMPFPELYSSVWRKDLPSDENKMITSIEVEMSALNIFAAPKPFQREIDYTAKVIRCRNAYMIKKETLNECCIIRAFSLPD